MPSTRVCSACGETGHVKTNKGCPKYTEKDTSTPDIGRILKKKNRTNAEQQIVIEYTRDLLKLALDHRKAQMGLKGKWGDCVGRLDGFSQELSQATLMLIFNHRLDDMTCRKAEPGDLVSDIYKSTECKCKTCANNAPGSCGGKQHWDTLAYLNASGFSENKYSAWILRIKDTDPRWDQFKRAEKNKGVDLVRPRLDWKKIEEVFKDDIEPIYEGSFEGIFSDFTPQTVA